MESIQELLNKINHIYQQGIQTKIDQDLLLDYIRRFYEQVSGIDLNNSAFSFADAPLINNEVNEVNTNTHFDDTTEESVPITETTTKSDVENTVSGEMSTVPTEILPENDNNEEADHEPVSEESAAKDLPVQDEKPEPISLSDEEQLEENLMLQSRNISFEPPHPAEESPLFLSDGIEEDQVEENVLPPQNIPVENPVPQQKDEGAVLTDYAKIFSFSTSAPTPSTTADIRKKIGINDKYLFLNELFNSDKSAYEKALDKINTITQYPEAVDWVKDNPAMTYKWHDDDDTVLDFYEVLRKYFNDK